MPATSGSLAFSCTDHGTGFGTLDATTVGQRAVVLAIRVVHRGCAVPVAWKILPTTETPPWQPEWLARLKPCHGLVLADWTVVVLADRGLSAKWRFPAMVSLGWHPRLRLNPQGQFRPQGWSHGVSCPTRMPAVGRARELLSPAKTPR